MIQGIKTLGPDLLQLLQDEPLAVNPYAQQYQNMGQVLQQQRQIAATNNQPMQPVSMVISKHPFQDRHTQD